MLRSRALGLITQVAHKSNVLFPAGVRHISEEQLGASADQVADLFERNLLKASRKKPDQPPRILTTRREALSLYREIWRYSALFLWHDERGRLFRDVIRASARGEFEAARFEPDPEIINKLIITGRDCVQRTMEAFAARAKRLEAEGAQPPLRQ
ncbi:hypothetical protein HYH02_005795 [Chlamydomonas schloesseri]|uniref:Complex 1 LYR protein domain-containing protein n=1 Tax=Chlamydomonas schloesseri TaxID=2026947 RepID=A0A836B6G5_9CHLO|nr:hypothetical protein HYH02_005795 [Chlamydomonas schloesseri]|eukprot:KAG2449046.1 hypothetical protein HYH02_005795 [Chlamydomonas schloesseri]